MCPWTPHIKTCSGSDICYMDFVNKNLIKIESDPSVVAPLAKTTSLFKGLVLTNVYPLNRISWLIPALNTVSAVFHRRKFSWRQPTFTSRLHSCCSILLEHSLRSPPHEKYLPTLPSLFGCHFLRCSSSMFLWAYPTTIIVSFIFWPLACLSTLLNYKVRTIGTNLLIHHCPCSMEHGTQCSVRAGRVRTG